MTHVGQITEFSKSLLLISLCEHKHSGMGELMRAAIASRCKKEVTEVLRGGEAGLRAAAARVHPTVTVLAYMQLNGLTQEQLASKLGTWQTIVSQVLDGSLLPNDRLREAFKAVCWIPVSHWDKGWPAK